MQKKKIKKVAILFSGGLDSTYLIHKNLSDGNAVTPIYITIENNVDKVKIEFERANKIWNLLLNKFNLYERTLQESIKVNVVNCSNNLMFSQVPIWILGALYSVSCSSFDEIQIGYVNGDSSIPFISDFVKIWNSYKSISSEKLPPLVFPLTKKQKDQLWCELPDEIRQLTYFCESPRGTEDCGNCASCERYKYEKIFYRYDRNESGKLAVRATEKTYLEEQVITDKKKFLKSNPIKLKGKKASLPAL